jgi:hypothetical protein
MRNISEKFVEKIKTNSLCSITFFSFESRAVYDVIQKNIAEPDRPQVTLWRMRISCWIPKAINTFSQYVIICAFPLQQWLHERASVLRSAFVARLVAD